MSAAPMPVDGLYPLRFTPMPEDPESCGISARSDETPRLEASGMQSHSVRPHPEPTYRNDPYSYEGRFVYTPRQLLSPPTLPVDQPLMMPAEQLPQGTLHWELQDLVTFVPYPEEEYFGEPTPRDASSLERLFIGQLPYAVTDMQLEWLCAALARTPIFYTERILKREGRAGAKLPTGCVHVSCHPGATDQLVELLHKRVLFDDTGVWYAEDPAQHEALAQYCQAMKHDKRRRFPQRPYDSVVVQPATSSHGGPFQSSRGRS